jgi:predicted methyltransferase
MTVWVQAPSPAPAPTQNPAYRFIFALFPASVSTGATVATDRRRQRPARRPLAVTNEIPPMRSIVPLFLAAVVATSTALAGPLETAVANPDRNPRAVARDPARHPVEVLTFIGVQPNATVVEIWPGGGYWTEILAPYLHDAGTYYAALGDADGTPIEKEFATLPKSLADRMAAKPDVFGRVQQSKMGSKQAAIAPAGGADYVLTFRNFHNWMAEGTTDRMLALVHRALKPNGVFAIGDHRSRPDRPQDPKAQDGYVRQDYAIATIEKAGFKLVGSSEVLANPRDTTRWPEGVWTLPPTYALKDVDRAKYQAIGEADNFLLTFRKVGS